MIQLSIDEILFERDAVHYTCYGEWIVCLSGSWSDHEIHMAKPTIYSPRSQKSKYSTNEKSTSLHNTQILFTIMTI